jgi:predicted PurR-regulated permease PerM
VSALVGIKHAMHRFNQYIEILNALIQSLFPKEDPDDDQHDALLADTSKISQQMLESMRKSQLESLKILFFFFDTVFAVFFISLTKRKFRFSRFIHLSKEDQVDYMRIWADSEVLNLAPVALKALIGYSYYTSHLSWDKIGYRGEVLRRSYIN